MAISKRFASENYVVSELANIDYKSLLNLPQGGDDNTPVYFSNGEAKPCTYLDLDTTGNANTATTLASPHNIQVDLASTNTASFDGSEDIQPGVTGTLNISNGGTG